MSLNFNVACRNAMIDAIETYGGATCSMEILTGTKPAACTTAETDTVLATINLPNDWMNAASSGSKTLKGTWEDGSANDTGTAGYFRIYNNQATKDGTTCFIQGTVSATGAGGDLELDSTSIVSGQRVSITGFTITGPNA